MDLWNFLERLRLRTLSFRPAAQDYSLNVSAILKRQRPPLDSQFFPLEASKGSLLPLANDQVVGYSTHGSPLSLGTL